MRGMFLTLFVSACVVATSVSVRTDGNVFYVLGGDGIYVIDPVTKSLVKKITNMTSPGLCTKSNTRQSRNPCAFSHARVVHDTVFVADTSGSAVHVIDVKTQKKIETIQTDPQPFGLYSLPWRKELWVHSWTLSTFDVIETEGRNRTHNAIRAHVTPGWTHGLMVAHKDLLDGTAAFVTHFLNPGIHKLNLLTKSYSSFLNFSTHGCTGTYGIAYNSYNNRLYVDCRSNHRSKSILELNPSSGGEMPLTTYNFSGSPFVSPNGRYIVVLYRYQSISRMNIIALGKNGSKSNQYPELRIPGGVSHAVFYPKSENLDSYYVFISLDYSNKMAVVDLDLAQNGNVSDVKYIENVDFLDTTPHGASRDLFISGKWIISPATKNKTVVIINAETQEVDGKVDHVLAGSFAVWVDSTSENPTSENPTTEDPTTEDPTSGSSSINLAIPRSLIIFLLFLFVF